MSGIPLDQTLLCLWEGKDFPISQPALSRTLAELVGTFGVRFLKSWFDGLNDTESSQVVDTLAAQITSAGREQAQDAIVRMSRNPQHPFHHAIQRRRLSKAEAEQLVSRLQGLVQILTVVHLLKTKSTDGAVPLRNALQSVIQVWCRETKLPDQFTGILATHVTNDVIDATCLPLLQQGFPLQEPWDLLRFFLGEQPTNASRSSSVRVLGVEGNQGFTGTLYLEWLPTGYTTSSASRPASDFWSRHLDVLLLTCDADFVEALDNAFAWTCVQDWFPKEPGSVRWRVTRDDGKPIKSINGNSMGGAFAVGLHALLETEYEESFPHSAVTGRVTDVGRLEPVSSVYEKLMGTENDQIFVPIFHIIHPKNEDWRKFNTRKRSVESAGTVEEAVEKLREANDGKLRAIIQTRMKSISLATMEAQQGMETLYQEIPVMQEVPHERVRESQGVKGEPPGTTDVPRPRYYYEIPAWTEAALKRTSDVEQKPPCTIVEAFQRPRGPSSLGLLRIIILGEPGGGKTTLLRWIAWMGTRSSAVADFLKRDGVLLLPAYIRLAHWRKANVSLAQFLAETYPLPDVPVLEMAKRWESRLAQQRVLLLFDGLDEVSEDFARDSVYPLLENSRCPVILTCRTVRRSLLDSLNLHVAPSESGIYVLCSLKESQQRAYLEAYPARIDVPKVMSARQTNPALALLMANPMLLSLIALIATKYSALPTTRSGIYEAAVKECLGTAPRDMQFEELRKKLKQEERRRFLEAIAYAMFDPSRVNPGLHNESQRRINLEQSEVKEILEKENEERRYGIPIIEMNQLMDDLRENSYLFVGGEKDLHLFLHLTLQEYLAACEIANWARAGKAGHDRIVQVVNRKSWLPEWREIIIFLMGRLKDRGEIDLVIRLLKRLSDPKQDDIFRHRLALAALCIREVRSPME